MTVGPCEACGGTGEQRAGAIAWRCHMCDGSGRGPEPFDWDAWRCPAPGYEPWDDHDPDCLCHGTGSVIEEPASVRLTIRKLNPEWPDSGLWTLQRVDHDGTSPTRRFVLPDGHRFVADTPSYRLEPMSSVEGYLWEWGEIASCLERGEGEDAAFANRCAATWVDDAVQLYSPRNCNQRRPTVDRASASFLAAEIRRVLAGGDPSPNLVVVGDSPKYTK